LISIGNLSCSMLLLTGQRCLINIRLQSFMFGPRCFDI